MPRRMRPAVHRTHAPPTLACARAARAPRCAALLPQVDGDWRYDARRRVLLWTIDLIDDSNRSGSLELVVPAVDPEALYPIEVSFSSPATIADIAVEAVVASDGGAPVKYGSRRGLSTASYQVV